MGALTRTTALVRIPPRTLRRIKIISLFVFGSICIVFVLGRLHPPNTARWRQKHPLDDRLRQAQQRWQSKVKAQSRGWLSFEQKYKRRYRMEPPDGMKIWFETAKTAAHVLVDEYNEMMEDLTPFRQLEGRELRRRTLDIAALPHVSLLNVRNLQFKLNPTPPPYRARYINRYRITGFNAPQHMVMVSALALG